jgi:GalNAc-alpha-(1->4)-GalNAc-alpha-(1->3)-diNAcBac-PP-undecaprenol alpha-1,4-N-acetyl-D-galactosaminyltransferase
MVERRGKAKFLFVIDNLNSGGAQRQMVNLATEMSRRGYRVELFCFSPGDLLAGPLFDAGIRIHWSQKASRFSTSVIRDLWRIVREGRFDLVLAFLTTPSFYAIVASLLIGSRRPPVVVSERFCDLPGGVPLIERFVRQFYRCAAHVTTNSNHQRINLEQNYPWLQNRLSTVYNGYDLNVFSPAQSEPDNRPLNLLTIASISPYKNGLCLVEALKVLRERYQLAPKVDWIGQRIMTGKRLAYLKEMDHAIKSFGLERQWRWLDQRSDILQQLHRHDVLIHPSYGEGLPNVVCEALASGRPVIASDTLDHARLVQNKCNGLLFNWKSPHDLADKIYLFNSLSIEARRKMGQFGREFAEKNLSIDRLGDNYERLFASVIQ